MNGIRTACLLAGIVLLILFGAPLVTFGICNIGNATGLAAAVIVLLCALFSGQAGAFLHTLRDASGPVKGLAVAVGAAAGLCILLALVISICMARAALHGPEDKDVTLIVLGCQVNGSSPSRVLASRLRAAEKYLKEHEETMCILSGGEGDDEDISEAACMKNYLKEHGISETRLIMEDQSTSTRENLQFSYRIIEEKGLPRDLAIVTSEFHEYRAFLIARKLGLTCCAVPARTPWWLFPTYAVREWYANLYEWLRVSF